jgi:hypothetical protein
VRETVGMLACWVWWQRKVLTEFLMFVIKGDCQLCSGGGFEKLVLW